MASSSVVCAIQYDVEAVGLRLIDVRRDRTQIGGEQLVRAIDSHAHTASVCRARMRPVTRLFVAVWPSDAARDHVRSLATRWMGQRALDAGGQLARDAGVPRRSRRSTRSPTAWTRGDYPAATADVDITNAGDGAQQPRRPGERCRFVGGGRARPGVRRAALAAVSRSSHRRALDRQASDLGQARRPVRCRHRSRSRSTRSRWCAARSRPTARATTRCRRSCAGER